MSKMLMICVAPPWPDTDGGRVRMARLAELLSEDFELTVAYPDGGLDAGSGSLRIERRPLPHPQCVNGLDRLRPAPRVGLAALGDGLSQLRNIVEDVRPDLVFWSHSYLAAVGRVAIPAGVQQVCDFANIEYLRYRSLAGSGRLRNRASAFAEAVKARIWEPRVARELDVCVAISPADSSVLRTWRSHAVLMANGIQPRDVGESPDTPSLLAVGNWEYGPNSLSMRRFLLDEWVGLLRMVPQARLVVVGKGSREVWEAAGRAPGVEALGYVKDLDPFYQEAALVLAPATSGGGSQLKVADALSRARIAVGPPYLERERSRGMPVGAIVASRDLATAIAQGWRDLSGRRATEREIRAYAEARSWKASYAELRSEMLRRLGIEGMVP